MRRAPNICLLGLAWLLGCEGIVDTPEGAPPALVVPDRPHIETCGAAPEVPVAELRRLTRDQLDQTIEDLLEDDSRPARTLPPDEAGNGFIVAGPASPLFVEKIATTAEQVASDAAGKVDGWLDCSAADAACGSQAIHVLGRRAWRRPLAAEEQTRLDAVFSVGAQDGGFRQGVTLVLQALLESPNFLYHVELPPEEAADGAVVMVNDYALASRLSYFIWGSMPDETLLDAAEAGELRTVSGLRAQALRLLDDEARGGRGFHGFYEHWLELPAVSNLAKDPDTYPDFDETVAASLRASLESFLDAAFREDGDYRTLMTSNEAWVNEATASIWGLDPAEFGEELRRVRIESGQRAGILTHPAVLARVAKTDETDPVTRGVMVRERFLCQALPEFPADNEDAVPPAPSSERTTRERYAEQLVNPECAPCHQLFNPIGFGFEHYDAVGAWREQDNGFPVDGSGEFVATRDLNGEFYGGVDMAERIAESREAQDCFATHVFRFALQRSETAADECSLQGIGDAFADAEFNLRALILAVVESDPFRFQRVGQSREMQQ
ncbi:MAG: DUF1592 domain-containing protein [Myxococcota bacterium]